MNNRNILIALRLLCLLVVDIFLVSRLEIGIYFVPHIYFLGLLLMPVRTSKMAMLFFGFVTGLVMDIFMNTGGIHAAASTLLAFIRIFTLRFYLAPEDEDNNISPGLYTFGTRKYLIYSSILVLIHQLAFFSLEVFNPGSILLIVKKTIASSILNITLLVFIQMLFMKPAKKKNVRRKR